MPPVSYVTADYVLVRTPFAVTRVLTIQLSSKLTKMQPRKKFRKLAMQYVHFLMGT